MDRGTIMTGKPTVITTIEITKEAARTLKEIAKTIQSESIVARRLPSMKETVDLLLAESERTGQDGYDRRRNVRQLRALAKHLSDEKTGLVDALTRLQVHYDRQAGRVQRLVEKSRRLAEENERLRARD